MNCVYCGASEEKTKFAKSHIIPDSLSNSKIKFNFVCDPKHNANFSREFETYVKDELAFLRNKLYIFTQKRRKKRAKYPVEIEIEGYLFKKNITSKYDFFNSKVKIGKIKDGSTIKLVDMKEYEEGQPLLKEFSLNGSEMVRGVHINKQVFFSHEMQRLAAKIGFEWYCKEAGIKNYDSKFNDIIKFITENKSKDSSIVEIVSDMSLYERFEEVIGLGGHALGRLYSCKGEVYVYFSFFNLVIYRIKIYKSYVNGAQRIIKFCGNWSDGTKVNFKIFLGDKRGFNTKICEINGQLNSYMDKKLDLIHKQYFVSIRTHKFLVDSLKKTVLDEKTPEQFDKLLGYKEEEKLLLLWILYVLGTNKSLYNYDRTFNENVSLLNRGTEKYTFDDLFDILKELYYEDKLKELFLKGCEIFYIAYEKEVLTKKSVKIEL